MRTLVEKYSQYEKGLTRDEKIEKGRPHIFNFDYPIFDVNFKKTLETNFIRNFYMKEIGFEVEGLFLFHLQSWFQLNMPYYNQLFESELIKFNPLFNVDLKEDYLLNKALKQSDDRKSVSKSELDNEGKATENNTLNSNSTSDTNGFDRELKSTTPQTQLEITAKNGEGLIKSADSINENSGNTNNKAKQDNKENKDKKTTVNVESETNLTDNLESKINSTDDYIRHLVGKNSSQSYSSMLNEYRQTFLRIELQMYKELKKLFMLIY